MDSVRLRHFAGRFEYGASLLAEGKRRDKLLTLAREARVRAAAREHGLSDQDPPGSALIPQSLPRSYRSRSGRRAA